MAGKRAKCSCGKVLVVPKPPAPKQPQPQRPEQFPDLGDDLFSGVADPASALPNVAEQNPFANLQGIGDPQAGFGAQQMGTPQPMAGPIGTPQFGPAQQSMMPAKPGASRTQLTGRQTFNAIFGIIVGVFAVPFGGIMAFFNGLGILVMCAVLFAANSGNVRAGAISIWHWASLPLGIIQFVAAIAIVVAGVGIPIGSICELTGSKVRTKWADMTGGVAGITYIVLTALGLLLFLVAGTAALAQSKTHPGGTTAALAVPLVIYLFFGILKCIVPAMLIGSFFLRRSN